MKNLDKGNLFNIFTVGDEELYKEYGVEEVLNSPFILLGMTIRGVENYYTIHQIYENRFKEEYDSVRDSIKLKYFITLVKYLERIENLPSYTVSNILEEFGESSVYFAFSEMLTFLEEKEYYEKCIVVKKFLDLFFLKELDDLI